MLRGITWKHPRGYEPLAATAAAWRRECPGVAVTWRQLPWRRFEAAVLANHARRTGRYDLLMLDHPWIGSLVKGGGLVPLDPFLRGGRRAELARDVVGPSTGSYRYGGRQWALPVDASCHTLLYRKDLLPSGVGRIPGTWEGLLALAEAVHDPPRRYAFGNSFRGVQASCFFLTLLASLGARPYEGSPAIDPAKGRKALALMRALLRYSHPASTRWDPWHLMERVQIADDIGMVPATFGYVNYFRGRRCRLAVADVPRFRGFPPSRPIVGGVGLAIAARSPHREEAWRYLWFVMGRRSQCGIFPRHHGQPARRSLWTDPRVHRATHGFYRGMLPNMERGYVRPTFPGYPRIELEPGATVEAQLDGRMGEEACLRRLEGIARACREEYRPRRGRSLRKGGTA